MAELFEVAELAGVTDVADVRGIATNRRAIFLLTATSGDSRFVRRVPHRWSARGFLCADSGGVERVPRFCGDV